MTTTTNSHSLKKTYIVKNQFKIVIAEGRWSAWLQAGQHTLSKI